MNSFIDLAAKAGDTRYSGVPSFGLAAASMLMRYVRHLGPESAQSRLAKEMEGLDDEILMDIIRRLGEEDSKIEILQAEISTLSQRNEQTERLLEGVMSRLEKLDVEHTNTINESRLKRLFGLNDRDLQLYDTLYQIIRQRAADAQSTGKWYKPSIWKEHLDAFVPDESPDLFRESVDFLAEVGLIQLHDYSGFDYYLTLDLEKVFLHAFSVSREETESVLNKFVTYLFDDIHWSNGRYSGNASNQLFVEKMRDELEQDVSLFLTNICIYRLEYCGYLKYISMTSGYEDISSISTSLKRAYKEEEVLRLL